MNFHDQNRPLRRRTMYWPTADLSAWGAHRRAIGRSIGGAGMNAPPTQGPVLVVKVHYRPHHLPYARLATNYPSRDFLAVPQTPCAHFILPYGSMEISEKT